MKIIDVKPKISSKRSNHGITSRLTYGDNPLLDGSVAFGSVSGYSKVNARAFMSKPNMKKIKTGLTDRLYDLTLLANSPMGLLLTLTYKESQAIKSPKSP